MIQSLTFAAHGFYLANSLVQAGACYYKKTSFDAFQKISGKNSSLANSLLLANIASIYWGTIQSSIYLLKDASFFPQFLFTCSFPWIGVIFSVGAALIINDCMTFRSPVANQDSEKARQIRWGNPGLKVGHQALFLTHLILSIALIVRSPLSTFFKINAALQAYSFYKTTTEYWLAIKKTVPINKQEWPLLKTAQLKSYFPMIPRTPPSEDDKTCSICADQTNLFYFDKSHGYCQSCTADYLALFQDRLLVNSTFTSPDEDLPFELTIQKNVLPTCPLCRQISPLLSENLEAWAKVENGLTDKLREIEINIVEEVS